MDLGALFDKQEKAIADVVAKKSVLDSRTAARQAAVDQLDAEIADANRAYVTAVQTFKDIKADVDAEIAKQTGIASDPRVR